MSTLSAALPSPVSPAVLLRTPWSARDLGPVLHFAADAALYGEGDDAEFVYKIVSGVVRTCKFLSDGRRQIDAFHVAGDVFGLEAAADYSLSAEAVCDCTVIAYRRRGLDSLTFTDAGLSRQLFACAMRSLARAQEHALLLGRRSAAEKVAHFLTAWATHSVSGRDVVLAMTRQDIADYLGLTIETVSRTLSFFEREALIAFTAPRQIRLMDAEGLRALNA